MVAVGSNMKRLMDPDRWLLYEQMLESRLFEEAVASLWADGAISGEMHVGTGEEAINAGVVSHLVEGDAMALDHRGTAPLLMRGVDATLLLREFLGRPDGLCGGRGGHMHLFSPEHLAASSGIVGASGPAAAGFALAGTLLRPGSIAVAFFGEGATNQGMMMEAMNLTVTWRLPVLFVCKDNDWSISTRSPEVTGGDVVERARSFGMNAAEVDGCDVEQVWRIAGESVSRAREGNGPSFIRATCVRPEGHFLGDHLVRIARHPVSELGEMTGPMLSSAVRKGGSIRESAGGLASILTLIGKTFKDQSSKGRDPIARTRKLLRVDRSRLDELEGAVARKVEEAVHVALDRPLNE